METLIDYVQKEFIKKNDFPKFSSGDTITVYYQIREGEKVRTQFFKGVVIQIKGKGESKTFTIRKMSGTIGVERIFPINLPTIEKIEINPINHFELMINQFSNELINPGNSSFDFERDLIYQAQVMDAARLSNKEQRLVRLDEIK